MIDKPESEIIAFKTGEQYVAAFVHHEPPSRAARLRIEFGEAPATKISDSAWKILQQATVSDPASQMPEPTPQPGQETDDETDSKVNEMIQEFESRVKAYEAVDRKNPWPALRASSEIPDGVP
jgi:hypothetical protein